MRTASNIFEIIPEYELYCRTAAYKLIKDLLLFPFGNPQQTNVGNTGTVSACDYTQHVSMVEQLD